MFRRINSAFAKGAISFGRGFRRINSAFVKRHQLPPNKFGGMDIQRDVTYGAGGMGLRSDTTQFIGWSFMTHLTSTQIYLGV